MTIHLAAEDDVTVSTRIEVDPANPRWDTCLVDAVTMQAQEGARRLRDQLAVREGLPPPGFVPLAALVPVADLAR